MLSMGIGAANASYAGDVLEEIWLSSWTNSGAGTFSSDQSTYPYGFQVIATNDAIWHVHSGAFNPSLSSGDMSSVTKVQVSGHVVISSLKSDTPPELLDLKLASNSAGTSNVQLVKQWSGSGLLVFNGQIDYTFDVDTAWSNLVFKINTSDDTTDAILTATNMVVRYIV